MALLLPFAQGCSADPGQEEGGSAEAPPSEGAPGAVLDEFAVDADTKVTVYASPAGGLVVVGEGPRLGDDADAVGGLSAASSVEALYESVARPIPAVVQEALERDDEHGALTQPGPGAAPAAEVPVDELARLEKEAPRNVSWFRSTFCSGDHMDEYSVREGWWRRNDWCQTERTNGFNLSFNDVRQGFSAVHMYRGSATLRYHRWSNGGWVQGGTYSVTEGRYVWVRVTSPSMMNLRFDLVNASGDGFNYSIHTANSNMRAMQGVDGTDWYHILCQCDDTWNWRNFVLEQCIQNPSDSIGNPTNSGAALLCGRFASVNNWNCRTLAWERRTMGQSCSASSGQSLKNCTDWPGLCSHLP